VKKIHIGEIIIGEEERQALLEVIDSGRITEGPRCREFESGFADYIGTRYATVVNSGTSALILGLKALQEDGRFPKIVPGKKVITSPVTYVATSNAIRLCGMEPVYVDIDPQTFKLKTGQVEEAVQGHGEDNIGLILPVHLMGYPNDMDELLEIAGKYDLQIFEDCAQAHGSIYKGRTLGTIGLMSAYSFYIAHNIQVGEMGALLTSDLNLSTLAKQLKANGRSCDCVQCTRNTGRCVKQNGSEPMEEDPRFSHDMVGYNFKTMDFCGALGCVMLKKAEGIRLQRYHNVKKLNELLADCADVMQLPEANRDYSYLGYPLIIKADSGISRAKLLFLLEEMGIENRPLFGCIPLHQKAYEEYKAVYEGRLPNADHVGKHGFYIGCHQFLDESDLERIASSLIQVLKQSELKNSVLCAD
jgi:CDP-6-deoxy-D-xylo-4-hexulose-3-dehydrase